jgi:uncharacterized protein (DUF1697 family)
MAGSYVALLYSITLTQDRRVNMAEWRAMLERLGLQSPRTLIATGNAVFESERTTVRALETRLEDAFEQAFGRRIDTIVRTAAAWRKLVAANPFPSEAQKDGSSVHVRVMREPLDDGVLAELKPYLTGNERAHVVNGDLWIHFRQPPSQTRLLPALTPKRLGIGTMRNWNTVRRLGEML